MSTKAAVFERYSDSASAMTAESAKAELQRIGEVYEKFDESARSIKGNTIRAANYAREIGLLLQTLCGHEQITFSFWQDRCGGLPFKFESAKIFIAIAKKMPEKAKTLAEAVPFVQQVLIADEVLTPTERTVEQLRGVVSIEQRFLKELTLLRQPYQKIIINTPMEQWDVPMLDDFIYQAEWIAEDREKAKRLRAEKAAKLPLLRN